MKLSLIVPAYNEEASLPMFLKSLSTAIASQPIDYEIIVVNDGSKDDTLAVAQRSARNDHRLRVLNLSRNFGKEIATSAGIAQATGDALIMIDADGQHPVEMIGEFLRLWQAGYQVVVGVRRTDQHEGIIKHYGSKLFYRLF